MTGSRGSSITVIQGSDTVPNKIAELFGDLFEHFPPEVFVAPDADTNYDKLPDLFFAGSYWVVSGAVADVMRRFDLGGGALYPTKVHRKDRKTPI